MVYSEHNTTITTTTKCNTARCIVCVALKRYDCHVIRVTVSLLYRMNQADWSDDSCLLNSEFKPQTEYKELLVLF